MLLRPLVARRPSRRGFTMIEATVSIVVVVIVVVLAIPTLSRFRERGRRISCHGNMHQIGSAIERYRTNDPAQSYPSGATYQKAINASGTSWWLEIIPFSDMKDLTEKWNKGPDNGDFRATNPNPNVLVADGFQSPLFFCPSSPLPWFNNPLKHWSEANRRAFTGDRKPVGIAVPMYVAVAGGAPDAKDIDVAASHSLARGRNTRDGKFGILSASGVMPVGLRMVDAAVTDTKSKTIIMVEQSDYGRDDSLDPPDLYDVRSAWPAGAFMGSTGDYAQLSPKAEGINGSGEARVWNVTTVRYPINTRNVLGKSGFVVDPAPPRPAKKGDPVPEPPPYPVQGYGPGHNHGIIAAHPGGANVLMADGTAVFLNEELDLNLLLELVTRDDGRDSGEF